MPSGISGSRKRNRSASTASDHLVGPAVPPTESPLVASSNKTAQAPNTKSATTRNRRGGARKQAVHEAPAAVEGGEGKPCAVYHYVGLT
jgi:hypothetical protein